jgi:hypothetical protein
MEAKHTPEPWFSPARSFGTRYVEARIGGGLLQEVAACGPTEQPLQQEANARLISAAPELLEALRELLIDMQIAQSNMTDAAKRDRHWVGCAEAIQPRVDAAKSAIAKATGETP